MIDNSNSEPGRKDASIAVSRIVARSSMYSLASTFIFVSGGHKLTHDGQCPNETRPGTLVRVLRITHVWSVVHTSVRAVGFSSSTYSGVLDVRQVGWLNREKKRGRGRERQVKPGRETESKADVDAPTPLTPATAKQWQLGTAQVSLK